MGRHEIALAVDAGGTKIAAAAVYGDGSILTQVKSETPQTDADAVVFTVASLLDKLIEPASRNGTVIGIGLAVAGTVDFERGCVKQSPNLPFSDLCLKDAIESQFKIATRLDNDGNLAVLGERFCGAATGAAHVIGLTLGTGIGSGIIIDGKLYRGASGSAAELGHMVIDANGPLCSCGSHGCFEELASGRALARVAKEKVSIAPKSLLLELADNQVAHITGPMVTKAALNGDAAALAAFEEIGYWLGIGLNNIVNIFNPELIVLGGGMADAGELVLAPASAIVRQYALRPNKDVASIVLSKLGNDAGLLGAAALVFDELA